MRLVQRMGRTGRKRDGHCALLLTSSEKLAFEETMRRAQRLATVRGAMASGRGWICVGMIIASCQCECVPRDVASGIDL